MRFRGVAGRLTTAVVVGVVTVGVSRLASIGGGEYVAVPVAGVLVHTLPAATLTWAIATFGGYADVLFALSAAAVTVALFTVSTLVVTTLSSRIDAATDRVVALSVAAAVSLLSVALTAAVVHAVGLGIVGGAITWLFGRLNRGSIARGQWSRREAIAALGGGFLAGFGALLAREGADAGSGSGTDPELSLPDRTRREIETLRTDAAARELDVPGLQGLITPIGEFYVVDITLEPPVVDPAEWSVSIEGAVDTELELTRERLTLFEPVTVPLTLRCIGEELNATLTSTAIWTGVPVATLLDRAGPRGSYAELRGADGYFEVLPVSMLEDALLVYAMNGRPLPREHGSPARVLVPGSWGKVNVKWIQSIEIRTEETDGFWSEWEGTSEVNTVAKLWQATPTDEGMVLGGFAYAGDRGIDAVEVSTDGGERWNEATVSDPLSHPATWRQWRYEWRPERDSVEVVVRAIDGEGRLQPEAYSEPKPDGATGWVSRRVDTTESTDFTRGYR